MVNLKLMQPQEIEVLYMLPAIRRELSIEMKKLGLEQKKIAEFLCVTEAAISQYMKSKRATKVKFDKETQELVRQSAKKIKNKESMLIETQALLNTLRDKDVTCEVHKKLSDIPNNCVICSIPKK
ncbi:hypothetical protein HQ533_01620 [Candidatus Woesearchaeota archaeon]|nr:hypothetical protein [Candidatus Woesearchaeota archaeon]